MMRRSVVVLLGLTLVLGGLLAACAPADEQPQAGAPVAGATPQVEGARATPGPVPAAAGQMPRGMSEFRDRLIQLEAGNPLDSDLVEMSETASGLMAEVDEGLLEMDPATREVVLREMSDISRLMGRVVHRHAELAGTDTQPGVATRPEYAAPTPEGAVSPAVGARQTQVAIQEMRAEIRHMSTGEPAPGEIVGMFGRMSALFETLADQAGTDLAGDVPHMVGEMRDAMDEMGEAVRAYAGQ
jgi:hypothetical protein